MCLRCRVPLSPEASISTHKRHLCAANLNSATSLDSKTFLCCSTHKAESDDSSPDPDHLLVK